MAESITCYISSYDTENIQAKSFTSYIADGATGIDNTSATKTDSIGTDGTEGFVYYIFDCSAVPEGAIITAITCQLSAYPDQILKSYLQTCTAQLYGGSTNSEFIAKGQVSDLLSNTSSSSITTLDVGSDWTRSDLNYCRLKIYLQKITSSSASSYITPRLNMRGAELTIEYTLIDSPIAGKVTIGNVSTDIDSMYVKVDDLWREAVGTCVHINDAWLTSTDGTNGNPVYIWSRMNLGRALKAIETGTYSCELPAGQVNQIPYALDATELGTYMVDSNDESSTFVISFSGAALGDDVGANSSRYIGCYFAVDDTKQILNGGYYWYSSAEYAVCASSITQSNGVLTIKGTLYAPTGDFTQGTTELGKNVATSASMYPTNGQQGDYWYVLQT